MHTMNEEMLEDFLCQMYRDMCSSIREDEKGKLPAPLPNWLYAISRQRLVSKGFIQDGDKLACKELGKFVLFFLESVGYFNEHEANLWKERFERCWY